MKLNLNDFGDLGLTKTIIQGYISDIEFDEYNNIRNKILLTQLFLGLIINIIGAFFTVIFQIPLYVCFSLLITSILFVAVMKLLKFCDNIHIQTKMELEEALDELIDIYGLNLRADMIRKVSLYRKGDINE